MIKVYHQTMKKERKDSLNYNNMNGENIKVILGNSVTSEGWILKNKRNTCS